MGDLNNPFLQRLQTVFAQDIVVRVLLAIAHPKRPARLPRKVKKSVRKALREAQIRLSISRDQAALQRLIDTCRGRD